MKIGYIRVSTQEQNTIRQEVLMEQLGVEKLYLDRAGGKNNQRPQLQQLMAYVRRGDTVIVESISRFARNTRDLLELVEQLTEKGVEFISQKESIDTTTTFYFYLTAFLEQVDRAKEFDHPEDPYPTIYRVDRIEEIQVWEEHFHVPYGQRFSEGEFRKRGQFMYGGRLHAIRFTYSGPSVEAVLDRLPTAVICGERERPGSISTGAAAWSGYRQRKSSTFCCAAP